MAFKPIKDFLKNKLEGISSIQEVSDFPTKEMGGFPCALVASSRMEADFETTVHNQRTYVFSIYLVQQISSIGQQRARLIVEETIDDIIEDFDQDQLLSGISLDSNETMLISMPLVSDIYVTPDEKYCIGELEIKIRVSFDTT